MAPGAKPPVAFVAHRAAATLVAQCRGSTRRPPHRAERTALAPPQDSRAYNPNVACKDFSAQPRNPAEACLVRWHSWAVRSQLPPVSRAAKTVHGVFGHHRSRVTKRLDPVRQAASSSLPQPEDPLLEPTQACLTTRNRRSRYFPLSHELALSSHIPAPLDRETRLGAAWRNSGPALRQARPGVRSDFKPYVSIQ